ncbi:IclR family transcriptional regulator [Nonomuraea sp. K274]|uniref:IclR family transcriptional regulator n=1 Tax=Nonomuraea cypriaca TaxID=1187855 RepID=A0A931AAN3_9ACTN|nr:IclR family transcriptional regulator [Nonomuraea cypriaca]MBF8188353.1 IclR family transcriptional regulator [Nonomuraea cypriaca]
MKPEGGKDSSTTRTLSRGLQVLSEILGAETPPTLTELAVRTGLAKATVSRLLATLVESGFASQRPGGQTYFAGPSIARWLRTSPLEALLAEQAAPALDTLRDLSGETSVLCVPVWPDRVCIVRSLAHSPIRAQKTIGESGPLTRGCSGRAFLAFAKDPYVDAALQARPLVRMTPSSLAEPEEFFARLRTERELGYAMSVGGTYPDMNGIAVPIFAGGSAMPVAVINVSGPAARWTQERMEAFAPTLKEHAARLTGYFTSERIS